MTASPTLGLDLPSVLATRHNDLLSVLVQPKDYAGEEWPEGVQFMEAYAPKAVAKILIGALHSHLEGYRIAFVWRPKMSGNGKVKLATAQKAAGQLHFFTDYDFVISYNWSTWGKLTTRQQIAVTDHELVHCGVEVGEKGTKCVLVPHDVEEFTEIITRWGLWKPDLERFGAAVVASPQLALFPEGS